MTSNKKPKIKQLNALQPIPVIDPNAALKIDEIEEKEENEPHEKSNKRLFLLGGIVLVLIILGVLVFAFFFYSSPPEEKRAVVVEEKEIVTPTPIPAIVRSEWSFEVLNGSGVAGVAGKAADQLIELGYQVVEIGNADRQTYQGNGLFVSEEMKDKVDLLVDDLKDAVKIGTVAGVLRDSTASARIIIGK